MTHNPLNTSFLSLYSNRMTTTLSNLSFSNNVYTVPSSGGGLLTVNQPTTTCYTLQYSPNITSNFNHFHKITIRDATSNVSASLTNSNLLITNQSSNLFSVSVAPYLQSNAFNTLSLNRQDNFLQVNLNNSAIVRITNSNELPRAYENSYLDVSTSNGSFSNVIYNPIATVDTPMSFSKPIKAFTISASNITSCNLTTISSNISSASNTASWSSNNLFNKAGGTITGSTYINAENSAFIVDYGTDKRLGFIKKSGYSPMLATTSNASLQFGTMNGIDLSTVGSSAVNVRMVMDGVTGNFGVGTTPSSSYKLDVLGTSRLKSATATKTGGGLISRIETNEGTPIALFIEGVGNATSSNQGIHIHSVEPGVSDDRILALQASGGRVGVNKTNPTSTLDVNGVITATGYVGSTITSLSNLAMSASNTATNASNVAYTTSNAFYTSTTSSTATYASNIATWSSNNLFQKSGGTITGGTMIQGDIYKNIPSYDPSYGDYSQFTISTNNNVVGQTYPSQLKLGVTNCNDGIGYIQTINPWIGMPNLVLQPNAGNVGVGRSNPLFKLDVNGNTKLNNATIGDAGHGTQYTSFCHSSSFSTGGYALLQQDIGETYLNCASGRNIRFRNNNNDMGIWDTNGRLGVNTTSPEDKLHVVGTAQFQGTTSPGSGIYSKCKWLNPVGGYGGLLVSHDATYGNQSIIDNSVNPFDVVVEGSTRLCVQKSTGRTGINTSNPQYTLHVAGTFFSSNISSPTIDNLSNAAYPAFNRSVWNSNNLFNKAGGTITGDVSILRGVGNPTTLAINSTGQGNTQSIIQFVNNGHTIVCADSNWNNQTRPTGGHCVFYTSGGHIFSGDAIFNGNLGGNAITNLSNMAIWSSNTARYSSNYGGTLCNLATDAFNKAVYGSNVANWSSNALLNPSFSNINTTGYVTLKPGSAGTGFTHLPYTNGKNYLRGDVIMGDTGGNVGIGTATPAYKLEVTGTTKLNVLQIGTNGDPMAEMSHYSVTIPSSGVKTFQLDVSGTFPSAAVVYGTVQSGNPAYDDCFGVTVMATSASNIKFSISRIDGNSWGSSHTLNFMVVGF
jgi:hypothetical protein